MTFGYEIEWGNVKKSTTPPPHIAVWEGNGQHSEVDIVNYIEGEGWVASSPINPLGGELNMVPQNSIEELTENFRVLSEDIFPEATVTPVQHGHVHFRADWFSDVERVKEFTLWCDEHYDEIIQECYPTPVLSKELIPGLRRFFKYDGGSRFTRPMIEKVKKATTLEEILNSDRRGNTTMRNARAFVNITGMRHCNTIEFRCFRMAANVDEFYNQMKFAQGLANMEIIKGLDLPKFDPLGLTQDSVTIQALNKVHESREDRKKLGKKIRLEWK